MNCPVCHSEMTEKDFGGVLVDVCDHGCKGMWFDWLELSRLDENNEGFGDALNEAIHYPRANAENRPSIKCPKCDITMKTHRYKTANAVNVDECYSCGGMFLDSGELHEIRENFMSDDEREEYISNLISSVPELKDGQENIEAMKTRAQGIRKMTRFICPSYYIKGK